MFHISVSTCWIFYQAFEKGDAFTSILWFPRWSKCGWSQVSTRWTWDLNELPYKTFWRAEILHLYSNPSKFLLPYLGLQSKIITKVLKACINKCYGCIKMKPKPDCRHNKASFSRPHITSSLFSPDKDRLNRSQMSKVVYKASCWDCQDFYIGKTKRRLHDRKTEHFKAITSNSHSSAIAEHITSTWTILAF